MTFDHDDSPMDAMVIRKIGPDLHVNGDVGEKESVHWTLRITYTFSGEELCKLRVDPSWQTNLYRVRDVVRSYTGISHQQKVYTHIDPAIERRFYDPRRTAASPTSTDSDM